MLKTHRSALAVLPPEEVWGPIQAIRAVHDRAYARWMPHVNLLYPFLDEAPVEAVERAAASVAAFEAELAAFRSFDRKKGDATLWLAPDPRERFALLQAALEGAVPACDDTSRHEGGFHPHLSVGQASSPEERDRLLAAFAGGWRPLRFRVDSVAWIVRGEDTPFEVRRRFSLAQGA